jgi:phosphoserine phosphatase
MHRLLVAQAEGRSLVARQIFAGREVARIERDWAPGPLESALTTVHFDPDGRLTFSWLKGAERTPVTERVSIPSMPRQP